MSISKTYIYLITEGRAYSIYACLLMGNQMQFLLPGGFLFCPIPAHYENPGFGGSRAKDSNRGQGNTEGLLL